ATPRVVRRAPQPAPQPVPQRVATTAPTPVTVAPVAVPKPAPKAQPVRRTARAAVTACPGVTGISAQYLTSASGHAVRCGPQAEDHVTRVQGTRALRSAPGLAPAPVLAAPRPRAVPAYDDAGTPTVVQKGGTQIVRVDPYTTRVAPRHVVKNQQIATRGVTIPDGYKRVWMDGRLNPQRAHQTFAGKAQMEMMWTKTLPRELILTDTGQAVTRDYPGLIYPYTSYEQQRAAMSAKPVAAAGTLSTRSRQPEAQTSGATRGSYVQAGVFSSRAQAEAAARRLAGTGMPARLGTMTRGGTRYSLVLSGPFASRQDAQGALQRVRGAGFGNARLR
ncbi:SPOR domain-containing protein, partial [Roseovarius aquimarinus]